MNEHRRGSEAGASDVAQGLASVRARVQSAVMRAGRQLSDVLLIAVSKTKPASAIAAAHAAGARDFGENYAQELAEKRLTLEGLADLRWHFIGRLQSNKARLVAPHAAMVHSVDCARLATELGRRAETRTEPLEVLVDVNIGGEPSKAGVTALQLEALLITIEAIPSLRLRGLMAIPPPTESPEASRRFHRALRELRDAHGGMTRLPHLSMGMTDDLEVAIEEGSTMVRVGTAIFGARTGSATSTAG